MENVTLDMIYKKLQNIEQEVVEINEDLHELKPEFIEKLRKIEKGKFHRFNSIDEMESYMDKLKD